MVKYGVLFNGQQAVAKLQQTPWTRGSVLLSVRKFLKNFTEVLQPFEEVRQDLVKKFQKDDKGIIPGTPEYAKFVEAYNEAAEAEVEWKQEVFLNAGDFEDNTELKLTAQDIDFFILLGIFKD